MDRSTLGGPAAPGDDSYSCAFDSDQCASRRRLHAGSDAYPGRASLFLRGPQVSILRRYRFPYDICRMANVLAAYETKIYLEMDYAMPSRIGRRFRAQASLLDGERRPSALDSRPHGRARRTGQRRYVRL